MKNFLLSTALGAMLITGGAAFAQAPDAKATPRGGPMMMADANKDGVITKAELTASLDKKFAEMDVNHDGKLTKEDREAMRAKRMDDRFAKLDANKDGQISKAEFTAGHQRTDADGKRPDGKRMGRFGGHGPRHGGGMMRDANKDGVITRDEFMAGPLAMFDRADTNKDGKVTAEEMKAARPGPRGGRGGHGRGGDMPPPPPAE